MMATIPRPRFDANAFLERTNDRSRLMFIDDVLEYLERVYGADSMHDWRRRTTAEGGYGPMGVPVPDAHEVRGEATRRPQWYPATIDLWAYQTGRRHLATGAAQKPLRAGKGPTQG